MQSSSNPNVPGSDIASNPSAMDLAVRAAFLEAFARELARSAEKETSPSLDSLLDLDLPENGFRPVNRLKGLL